MSRTVPWNQVPWNRGASTLAVGAVLLAAFAWSFVEWTVNRVYVPVGESLMLRYKGPLLFGGRVYPAPGQLARVDEQGRQEIGVLEQMLGPGRHFRSPVWWECTLVEDKIVNPGEVAIVTSKVGIDVSGASVESPPGVPAARSATSGNSDNQFLVEGDLGKTDKKGVLRKVYSAGRYRVNPYAYEFRIIKTDVEQTGSQSKHSGWVEIPTGHVGVVTNQTDNPLTKARKGIQQEVLPPGIYPMNPFEQKVDIVEIGFREKSIISTVQEDAQHNPLLDASGEPVMSADGTGISFPSKDGFTIHMDFTAIWGIMPEQATHVVEFSGNLEAVENRVVVPLIESICRNEGSRLGAVDLLVGDTREEFQEETTKQFEEKLRETGVVLQYGLVRHIYIPQDVRLPIQQAFLADELKLTRDQEQTTTKTEGNLREAEQKVELESERIRAETEKMVAAKKADGNKEAEETKAETIKLVAEIARKTAELDAKATVTLGEAEADSQKLFEEAKAEKFKLAVGAFGTGQAYNQWVFASGLPEDIKLQLLYAGPGTFWTDLKGFSDVMLGRQVQQSGETPSSTPATRKKP